MKRQVKEPDLQRVRKRSRVLHLFGIVISAPARALFYVGEFCEFFFHVPLSFLLTILSKSEREWLEDEFRYRDYLYLLGLGGLTYGLPLALLFLGYVGGWILVVFYSALILAVVRSALGFFRPVDHPDGALIDCGMQGVERQPVYVLMVWLTRYLNLSFFFWALFCGLNVISLSAGFHTPAGGVPSPGDLFYFSIMTITTLGYGGVVPADGWAKGLTALEVLSGMWILLICLSVAIQYSATRWGRNGARE